MNNEIIDLSIINREQITSITTIALITYSTYQDNLQGHILSITIDVNIKAEEVAKIGESTKKSTSMETKPYVQFSRYGHLQITSVKRLQLFYLTNLLVS